MANLSRFFFRIFFSGTDDGEDLPSDLLSAIYDRVEKVGINVPQRLVEKYVLQWSDCIIEKNFKSFKIVQFIITALKSITKLVKLQSLVAKEQRIKFFGREIFRQKNGWFPRG